LVRKWSSWCNYKDPWYGQLVKEIKKWNKGDIVWVKVNTYMCGSESEKRYDNPPLYKGPAIIVSVNYNLSYRPIYRIKTMYDRNVLYNYNYRITEENILYKIPQG
jgi:hypothetical protein